MDENKKAVIREVIEKLKSLLNKRLQAPHVEVQSAPVKKQVPRASLPQVTSSFSIPSFDDLFQKCRNLAQQSSPLLLKLTEIYGSATTLMKKVIMLSQSSAKYSPEQQQKLKNKLSSFAQQLDIVQQQNSDYLEHCRSLKEMIPTTHWVFASSPASIFKRSIMSADYWAHQFERKNIKGQTQWYQSFHAAVKELQLFTSQQYPKGLTFGQEHSNCWDLLIEDKIRQTAPPILDIKPKICEEASAAPTTSKKQPKKEVVGQVCSITNFQNQTVELTPEDIQMKHGIFFQNCQRTHLKITTKFKSIVISRCQEIILEMNSCISGVEIINCKNVKIYVHDRTPSISADTSESVNLVLNQNNLQCDIVSSKTSQLTVAYRCQDGSESKAIPVSSQLVTKWNQQSNRFMTAVYDKFL